MAKEFGYNSNDLEFSDDGVHKLQIKSPYGIVKFGASDYNDFIIYTFLETINEVPEGTALKKRKRFHNSHSKIKGKWKNDDYSPNNLALRILW